MKSLYELRIHIFTDDDGISEVRVVGIKDLVLKTGDDEERELELEEEED